MEHFDRVASRYAWIMSLPPVRWASNVERATLTHLLADHDWRGVALIDVGAGIGGWHAYYRERGVTTIIAVDRSRAMLIRCDARSLRVVADACALPFRDRACDIATLIGVLNYVADALEWLAELHRVARREVVWSVTRRGFAGKLYQLAKSAQRVRIHLRIAPRQDDLGLTHFTIERA